MGKASMVAVPRQMCAYVDEDGNVIQKELKVNTPMPITFVDSNGELQHGVHIIRPVHSNSEWWWKVMMSDLLRVLEEMSGKQTQALKGILDSFDPHNGIVIKSQREIAEDSDCSLMTVNKVMKILRNQGLIKMKSPGVYVINPNFMSQGNQGHFGFLLQQYVDVDDPNTIEPIEATVINEQDNV